jgi:hypothetical protein
MSTISYDLVIIPICSKLPIIDLAIAPLCLKLLLIDVQILCQQLVMILPLLKGASNYLCLYCIATIPADLNNFNIDK